MDYMDSKCQNKPGIPKDLLGLVFLAQGINKNGEGYS